LVSQAQPFGETEVAVFDTEFLPAPAGPGPEVPAEPVMPAWIVRAPAEETDTVLPPPIAELTS